MVHKSSHKTPDDISGAVIIFWKYEFVYIVCLGLVAGVSIYMMNPVCFHLVVFMSCPLILLLWPLLAWFAWI